MAVQQPAIEGNSQMQAPMVDKMQQEIKDEKFHQEPVVV